MGQPWLTSNDAMETALLSNGIPRHLGWTHLSQIAEWAVATHGIAEKLHTVKLQETQAYMDMIERLPVGKQPLNHVLGMNLDKAVVQSAKHGNWPTTQAQLKAQKLSLEFARALRDHLAANREYPDLISPKGVESEDALWLVICPSAVLLATVPAEFEEAWCSGVAGTSRMRSYPVGYSGLDTQRIKMQPDSLQVEEIWNIAPQFKQWVFENLTVGAAIMNDLVIPVVDLVPALG